MSGILVITTAGDCPACVGFKTNQLARVKSDVLTGFNKIQIVELDLPARQSQIPSNYPADHGRFVAWFPTFSLYDEASWKSALQSENARKKYKLRGEVFNGHLNAKGQVERISSPKALISTNIMRWIESIVVAPKTAPENTVFIQTGPTSPMDRCPRMKYVGK